MSRTTRKFVAVLMLLWLPLFSGSALAASIPMQLGHGGCHEAAMQTMMPQTMSHHDMSAHHHQHDVPPASTDKHAAACDTCEVCHLVGTGYLSMPDLAPAAARSAAHEATPYLVAFVSHISTPLVPPPLVRA